MVAPKSEQTLKVDFYIRTSIAAKTMLHCVKCLDFDADADTILSQSINFAKYAWPNSHVLHIFQYTWF